MKNKNFMYNKEKADFLNILYQIGKKINESTKNNRFILVQICLTNSVSYIVSFQLTVI